MPFTGSNKRALCDESITQFNHIRFCVKNFLSGALLQTNRRVEMLAIEENTCRYAKNSKATTITLFVWILMMEIDCK